MNTLLLVFLPSVSNSYARNIEQPAEQEADTVQFLPVSGQAWRVKTFSIDHDVHVWSLGPMSRDEFEELARTNTAKHYGDVVDREIVVEAGGTLDALKARLADAGLPPHLETSPDGTFGFWVPAPGVYESRTAPQ